MGATYTTSPPAGRPRASRNAPGGFRGCRGEPEAVGGQWLGAAGRAGGSMSIMQKRCMRSSAAGCGWIGVFGAEGREELGGWGVPLAAGGSRALFRLESLTAQGEAPWRRFRGHALAALESP